MKYIITESKAKDIILKYLDVNIEPDYSWGPELHDFYREDVERHGNYDFVINDRLAYSYWDGDGIHKHLEVCGKTCSLIGSKKTQDLRLIILSDTNNKGIYSI
jgi:hypothetical protein